MNISVVMATYNGEKFIREQMESILNQSVIPDEIIITDDCSSDSTMSILEQYQQRYPERIKVITNPRNVGYAYNFWNAIKHTQGEIIFLSDQDDVWYSNKIEEVLKIMHKDSRILALSTAYELIDRNGRIYEDIRNVKFHNNDQLSLISWKRFLNHPKYPGMAMTFRRSVYESIGTLPMEKIPPHDWLINYFAASQGGLYLYDKVLVQYRQHENNVVGSSAREDSGDHIKRIEVLGSVKDSIEVVTKLQRNGTEYSIEDSRNQYLHRIANVYAKRICYIKENRLMSLFFFDLLHINMLSFRGLLGDMYYCMKSK